MPNVKITVDGRSFILGLMFCFGFFLFSGFNAPNPIPAHDIQTGKFHVVSVEGKDIILDTETGEFVFSNFGLRPNMYRFKFEDVPFSPVKTRTK